MYFWLFLAGATLWLAHSILYDLLVRHKYQTRRYEWEKDGRPEGFFWRLSKPRSHVPKRNYNLHGWKLLWVAPIWVNHDTYAWWLLYGYRVSLGLALPLTIGLLIEILLQDMFR